VAARVGVVRSWAAGEWAIEHTRSANSADYADRGSRRAQYCCTSPTSTPYYHGMDHPLGQIGGVARRHRLAACMCLAAVLLPLLTFAYSSAMPNTYSATVRAAVYAGGPDPLIQSPPLTGLQLEPYLAALRSPRVAQAAVQRLPEAAPRDKASLVKASADLRREVTARLGPQGSTLEVTAKASSQGQAANIADAFVGGLQQLRVAEAQNLDRRAVAAGLELAARPPRGSRARRAAIAAYVRRLVPVSPDTLVQIVQPAEAGSPSSLAGVGIATVIAILALLMTGVWRPRPSHALP
jgi:hypothetical protein